MDYYQILGVSKTASADEIKKAYKKLAMKNHPDRGGDTQQFQTISQAYDTLSDSQKRAEYDQDSSPFSRNPHGEFNFDNMQDIFSTFAFGRQGWPDHGFANSRTSRSNKDLSIRVAISFKQSFLGTQLEAKFTTPSGKAQTVVVDIPAGVISGQTIRYQGLGDDTIPGIPRGNLNVSITVESDPTWERRNNDLYTVVQLSLLEAIQGCTKTVTNLDGSVVPLVIRPGIVHGTEFASNGRGFRDLSSGHTGRLVISIGIKIPAVTDPTLLQELQQVLAKLVN